MKNIIKIFIAIIAAVVVFSCNKNPLDDYNHTTDVTVKVKGIELSSTSKDILVGQTFQLTATVLPKGATNKVVFWSSSNENIAFVSDLGTVAGMGEGIATITAKTMDGGFVATCQVKVTAPEPIYVESVLLDKTELAMIVGGEETLHAMVEPEDAYDKSVTWASSDNKVASVDGSGVVKALSAGSTTITVTTVGKGKDGNPFTANCIVTVTGAPTPPEPVDNIDGDVEDITYEQSGEKE